jgi:putative ATP-binding cassette transporter
LFHYCRSTFHQGLGPQCVLTTKSAVLFLSLIYFPILAASVASTIIQVYVRMTLQRRWRAWLNDRLIDRWLANGRYYLLSL